MSKIELEQNEDRSTSGSDDARDTDDHPLLSETGLPMMLESLMQTALEEEATDVHIDASGDSVSVRFRVDGAVHLKQRMPVKEASRLINQIKVAAKLDIEQAHDPLEAQFHWTHDGQTRDVRVTIVPTLHQASAHLRLLTPPSRWRSLTDLGMGDDNLDKVRRALSHQHGLVLVSGQSGSGKTTTLYAMVGAYDLNQRVAVSIEDPVEFDLPNVRQVEVDEDRGLSMAGGLKTLLRMDPDILMVGEVRDKASAVTAGHAAIAGRLVMATIHARDAASAIDAMHFEAVPYYILGGALRLVIAQSLVRVLCPDCKRARKPEKHEVEIFERFGVETPDKLFTACGCSRCNDYGYHGRTGVFEVVQIDDEFGSWLFKGPHQHKVRERIQEMGVKPIMHDALRKVAEGETTISEAARFLAVAETPEQLMRKSSCV